MTLIPEKESQFGETLTRQTKDVVNPLNKNSFYMLRAKTSRHNDDLIFCLALIMAASSADEEDNKQELNTINITLDNEHILAGTL